jgi:AmiR/NasT family two-component response regulator
MTGDSGLQNSLIVAHAQGIVMVQARCTFADALTLLNERARVEAKSVEEIAEAVLLRRIRFRAKTAPRRAALARD